MSEQTATVVQSKKTYLAPFEFEISYGDRWFASLGRKRYRGKWSRFHLAGLEGSMSHMSQMPDVPGLHFKVTPKDRKIVISDPLEKDTKLLTTITRVYARNFLGFNANFQAVASTEKVCDEDRFKTFLIEFRHALYKDPPGIEMVSGEFPNLEEIESLPGRELNDPAGDGVKPKYKGDMDRHRILLDAMAEKGIVI